MNEAPELKKPEKEKQKDGFDVLDLLETVVAALFIGILVFSFVARATVVFGSSMVPTLEERQMVFISRIFTRLDYGDIVVLRKSSFMDDPIIKRVIATEGQTIDIDFQEGVVYVDGVALDEPYVNTPTYDPEDFEGPLTVPEGCIFVMGDNRNRSTDSRSARVGCIDTQLVTGKVLFRMLPLNKFGRVG